jgi:hypothetical protein
MNRRHYAISLQQASEDSPTLAKLAALTRESSERLQAIELLIPALRARCKQARSTGQAGVFVKSNAAAADGNCCVTGAFSRGWRSLIRLKIQS